MLALQDAYIRAGFGERDYHNATNLNLVGALAVCIAMAAACGLQRKRALAPLLLLACFVPTGQRVAIATLDFNLIRLLLLAYALRALVRGEYAHIRLRTADKAILAWGACRLLAYTGLHASSKAFIFQTGQLYDFLGLYFVGRLFLGTWEDVRSATRLLAMISAPVALFFVIEHYTARNLFSTMGGVPEFTSVRDGRLRCQGPYEHPILAGSFWASLVPLFVGMTRSVPGRDRRLGKLGIGCSLIVVVACSSSTPLIGLASGLGLSLLFSGRKYARQALIGLAALLTVVHFAREAPVWQLIAKAGVVGGSTATYRYRLIDAFIRNWSEWLLLGTKGTAHWGYYLFDLTNQYVVEGVRGGAMTLMAFCLALSASLHRMWSLSLKPGVNRSQRLLMWHAAAALGGMSVMFLGISITHSNQTTLVLMLLLAASQSVPSMRRTVRDRAGRITGRNDSSSGS